ncbi:lymphocyte antigen 6 complex locus protein G5b [Bubalus bubalis]|uniref:lymphocyte antigen 6 complex locus protein G5b n=1 Tax=Bubalus bubalis TaxID=89462 RepID=UPI00042CF60C|nr:lymphocyte antigen 6 complex locus protein G5b [Bubalus bubalis]
MGRWGFWAPLRDCPSPQKSMMKAHMLIGAVVMVGFTVGKAPVSEVRTCHLCLLENPAVGCISGSEKCTISSSSPCMVISINHENKARFLIRGCGQHNSYRCQEKLPTYISEYWYSAQCCQYDYCNSWYSPQLQSASPEPLDRSLALPLSQSQILWFYQTLNLSLSLPSFPAGREPSEGLDPLAGPPVNLSLSIADLRSIYLFLNSSGLLTLPWAGP